VQHQLMLLAKCFAIELPGCWPLNPPIQGDFESSGSPRRRVCSRHQVHLAMGQSALLWPERTVCVTGGSRYWGSTEGFFAGPERFLSGTEQFLGGTEQFSGGTERFFPGTERFSAGPQ
jgi:hypothetical protein